MFIKLHDKTTSKPFRVNVAHIVKYSDHLVYTDTEDYLHVWETEADIDDLLGLWEE